MMFTGELALVTGASRGIGRACALALGRAGAKVVGTATSQGGADAIGAYLAEAGIAGKGMVLDVGDAASIEAFLGAVDAEFGTPYVLVNNAGITRDNLLLRMKEEEWQAVIQTNLTSVFRLSKAVLRGMMKQRKGRIINIGSVVGVIGNPGQANYCAAKAGIIGFTKSLARELGSRNIRANVVAPGYVKTQLTDVLPEEATGAMLENTPLGRLGDPEDVAGAVRFLCSDAASFITGEVLLVDGGLGM